MNRKRVRDVGAAAVALLGVLGAGRALERPMLAQGAAAGAAPAATAQAGAARGAAQASSATPVYRVQPFWPHLLPDHWVLGAVSGVAADSRDSVWVVHRGAASIAGPEISMTLSPATSHVCCVPAPSVLQFDTAGRLLSSFGGPRLGYAWPQSTGGIAVDGQGNVWITAYGLDPAPAGRGGRGGGRGRGAGGADAPAGAPPPPPPPAQAPAGRGAPAAAPTPPDAHVLKFSPSGQLMLTIGTPGQPGAPDSRTGLNRPAGVAVDSAANEVYIADSGNHRIVVFDAATGDYKRHWGGSGQAPTAAGAGPYDPNAAPSPQFRDPTCVKIAKDGMVYVCDRSSNRIQVFQKDGKFVKEMVIAKDTLSATTTIGTLPLNSAGSVWDVAFSSDAQQRWLFVADGHNKRIRILRRETLAEVGSIGGGGRVAGRFLTPSTVAVDSRGNLYTGEAHHTKRVQKFVR